ncbi:type I polyketide synthase [Paenibacillus sp. MZ03-122A]|uniref:type I polyketide synthase n=1 Tax=Paenibacillus sp. MZ03-122A TaxID=2962033 RepID=UPI0020B79E79|nr:beta-ketoacyl synthase N-terminal-like domain-containing protein [Paenibacillus sp. MZ03-122A]MCP3778719.1 hypothetical protein [Paenibacillus sp. MZ03-122A]
MRKKLIDFEINAPLSQNDKIQLTTISNKDIAVIGLSCRIGKSNDVNLFWQNLCNGNDDIREFPDARKDDIRRALFSESSEEDKLLFSRSAFLDEIDKFDHQFFSISRIEANLIDPNQRLFLETAYAAIEDAGYGGRRLSGSQTGVFLGYSGDSALEYKHYLKTVLSDVPALSMAGNVKSIIASRISYFLDLKGPSMLVDTACSSSLVAIHLACKSIRSGECDLAIAGGVKIIALPVDSTSDGHHTGIKSSDGFTKTFDDRSDGMGSGEGTAAVLLKPLQQAINDGDHIYAVVKGSAWNQDGTSVSITAPNGSAQEHVILKAWQDAEINPETISYIEANGTGTKLGDPIEVQAITSAFRKFTNRKQFCAIGSVKSNVGSLDHASGIVGFIKAVLALKNRKLPPSLHFERPNQNIEFVDSPIYVNNKLSEWETEPGALRRCGVSSFGLSGTNCHIVLEESISSEPNPIVEKGPYILALSAMFPEGLKQLVNVYRTFLINTLEQGDLGDICFTANWGRFHYSHRLIIKTSSKEELIEKLDWICNNEMSTIRHNEIYYGVHNVVPDLKSKRSEADIAVTEQELFSLQANKLISVIGSAQQMVDFTFTKLAKLYILGADIEWSLLYTDKDYRKVSVPIYPFMRSRCWPDMHNEIQSDGLAHHSVSLFGRLSGEYTLMEYLLASVWGRLLDIQELNIHSDFFQLGGHSLLVIQCEVELEKLKVPIDGVVIEPGLTFEQIAKNLELNIDKGGA